MYVRMLKLKLKSGCTRADMEAMADFTYPQYKAQPGFVSATFIMFDESKGECGSVILWKTKSDAEAGAEKIKDSFVYKFGDKLAAPADADIFEVYEPK